MKTRQIASCNIMYRAVMPHSEICLHMEIAGKVMKFRIDENEEVRLYDPETGKPFSGPILPYEAGLHQDDGEWYFYPVQEVAELPSPTDFVNQKMTELKGRDATMLHNKTIELTYWTSNCLNIRFVDGTGICIEALNDCHLAILEVGNAKNDFASNLDDLENDSSF